jgi:adhesin/invasin
VVTDWRGLASVSWTLGSAIGPGTQVLTVSSDALPGSTLAITASSTVAKGTQVTAVAGDGQQGEVATSLPNVSTVVVRNGQGEPVAGAPVRWSVVRGGGNVDPVESVTDEAGRASTRWSIGPVVGEGAHRLEAAVSPTGRATLTATGVLSTGVLTPLSGDLQSGFAGWPLSLPLSVRVATPGPGGVGVSGVVVSWAAGGGGGSTKVASSVTGLDGTASVVWTLGSTAGEGGQVATATVPGLTGSPLTFVATARPAPAVITKVSGEGQSAIVQTALPAPLVVRVDDAAGQPVAGAAVQWRHLYWDGWGTYSSSTTNITNDDGLASLSLTLKGWYIGSEAVEARVVTPGGVNCCQVTFQVTVLPGPPDIVGRSSGDNQVGPVGALLPVPLVVFVADAYWNPIAGVTVEWATMPGDGSTTATTSVTDAQGLASTGWILGPAVGTGMQHATASVAGLKGSPVGFTASGTPVP